MSDILIVDHEGQQFKCGTTPPVAPPQGVFPLMAASRPSWVLTMDQIVTMAGEANRTKMRDEFSDFHWMDQSNQGSFGSCQGWTCADVITILRKKRGIEDNVVFSGSYVYSLLNGGQDNGSALVDGLKEIQTKGTVPVSMCPPTHVWRKDTTGLDEEAAKHIVIPGTIFELQNWTEILSAAVLGGVVNFAVMCDRTRFANYKTGIVPITRGVGNHSVTGIDVEIVNGTPLLVMKNHWGRTWGMAGFGYVSEGSVTQTIPVHGAWAAFGEQEASV